jgi:CHAT domain-containing protein/Tfp pilus assembly protein PilF
MADGHAAFQRGDFPGAALRWHEAARLYDETTQPQARSVALTHLARAYEALGHADRAEDSLRTALPLAETAGDQAQAALILGHLGELALSAGNVAEAERLVREALGRAQALEDAGLTATLWQTQGNVFMAQQHWSNALAAYRDSARVAQQAAHWGIAARAQAQAALAAERAGQAETATALLDDALAAVRQAPPSHDSAAELLSIGRTYHRLAPANADLVLRAAAVFQEAATLAQTLGDPRALSYAWGYLGRLYEEAHRYAEALDLTRRAAFAAQQVDALEALYQWQWQTGRVLRALGQVQPALEAYTRAVNTVQALPIALRHEPSGLRGTFQETVGSLFVERADLLLQQAAALEAQPARRGPEYEESLRQARATIELLKTAELRDYFGDACVAAAPPRTTALEEVASHTAVIYPMLLPDRVELLVSLPRGLTHVPPIRVPGPQVAQRALLLRRALQARDPERYLQHAQRLYQWLIQPLEADLAAGAIQTLVFVPDGALRLIPFAALHDGQQYLIEKYAVAITPSLTLTDPHPLPRERVHLLAAGVAEAVGEFPALPYVTEELQRIQQLYGATVLLDEAFSPARLDQTLRQGEFEMVHIAAHGRFAPQADASFLLTPQGKLTLPQLGQILGRLRFRAQPIELLTLSACETAQGDDRAALGLAGVAIQAGARSAVATLWRVADEAAARLMQAFYQQLRTPGVSRARALQQAQLALLHDPQYAEPFFWAPFLLINNWL